MTKFQASILILNAVFASWAILRAESVLTRIDTVTATTNRALDNLERVENVIAGTHGVIDHAGKAGTALVDKLGSLRLRSEPKP